MKRHPQVFRRCLSMLLVVAMVFGMTNTVWAAGTAKSSTGEKTVTGGQLVAENYACLSAQEQQILSSTALKTGSYTYAVPGQEDELVTVDPEEKTVIAAAFATNGFTWQPIAAEIKYDGGSESVSLTDGKGTFTYAGNTYRVEVSYRLVISVDTEKQAQWVNVPHYLAKAVNNLQELNDITSTLQMVGENIGNMQKLAPLINSQKTRDAINALAEEVEKYGTLKLDYLYNDGFYWMLTTPLACLYDRGVAIRESAEETYANLKQIYEDGEVKALAGTQPAYVVLNNVLKTMKPVVEDSWSALNQEVENLISPSTYDALSELAENAIGFTKIHNDGCCDQKELVADETIVSYQMNQYNVQVVVSAQAIPQGGTEPTALTTYQATVVLPKGTSAETVVAAIADTGAEAKALASWDEFYAVNTDNYDRKVTQLSPELEGDVTYTITYTPKELAVSLSYDPATTTLPYGYNLLLPVHQDAAKSYDYWVNEELYNQGDVYRVVGTTKIRQEEGKAKESFRLSNLVADNYEMSAQAEAILRNSALNSPSYLVRVPGAQDALVTIAANDVGHTVEAKAYSAGVGKLQWTAVSGVAKTNDGTTVETFVFHNGTAELTKDFDYVEVTYGLDLDGVTEAEILAMLNLPHVLATEADEQMSDMELLLGQYSKLGELNKTMLSALKGMIEESDMTQEAKAAIAEIIDSCVNQQTGKLYAYDYLSPYQGKTGGAVLSLYYTDPNLKALRSQMELLQEKLPVICDDPAFPKLLEDAGYGEYKEDIDEIIATLEGITLPAPNDAINTASASLNQLAQQIASAVGNTQSYETADRVLKMSQAVTQSAPDKAVATIVVNIVNGSGEIAATQTGSLSFKYNKALSEEDIAQLQSLLSSLETQLGVDKEHYTGAGALPEAGTALRENVTYTFTWSPKTYTVSFVGADLGAVVFTYDNPTVRLPAPHQAGVEYRYTIGGQVISVGVSGGSYTFTEEEINAFVDGSLTVAVEVVDLNREAVLNLVADLNAAMIANGMTDGSGNPIVAFLPMEDEKGNLSVVMRVAPEGFNGNAQGLAQDAAKAVMDAFAYVGINDRPVLDEGKVYVQAVVDSILNTGFGLQTVLGVIDETGNIVEMTPPGTLIASENEVNNPELLGGKLMEMTLQLGQNGENAREVTLYVTLEDFDKQASQLKSFRKNVQTLSNYADVSLSDGEVNVTITKMPKAAATGYFSALLVLGNADVADFNNMSFGQSVDYFLTLLVELFRDENMSFTAIENTVAQINTQPHLAIGDISGYEYIYNVVKHLADNAQIIPGDIKDDSYLATINYSLKALLEQAGSMDLSSLIAEAESGLDLPLSITFAPEEEYEALILDPEESVLDMIRYSTDVAADIGNIHAGSVVILLSDVEGLSFSTNATLNLNGKTVMGDISTTAQLRILDSTLSTQDAGTVEGAITGNVTISAGHYTSDVSGMLEDGYLLEEGQVVNRLFTIDQAEGNVNIRVDADIIAGGTMAELEAIAMDLAVDLVFNYYTSASLSLGGYTLYDVEVMDALEQFIGISTPNAINLALDKLNLEGIEGFANAVLAELTDFGSLKQAVAEGTPLVSYEIKTGAWDIDLRVEGTGTDAYVTGDILSGELISQGNVNVYVVGDETQKHEVEDLLGALEEITRVCDVTVSLDDVSYVDGKLDVDYSGAVTVDLDMTGPEGNHHADYPAVMAVVIGYANPNLQDKMVEALNTYLYDTSAKLLKEAIESVTIRELITALKTARTMDFATMVESLNLVGDVSGITALEDTYDAVLQVLYWATNKMGVTGNDNIIGSYLTDVFGTYSTTATKYGVTINATIALFHEDVMEATIVVKNADGVVIYRGTDLAAALQAATQGSTVLITKDVTLAQSVAVNQTITITGADHIQWNGKQIVLGRDGQVTIDTQAANGFTTEEAYCQVVETKVEGGYTYRVQALVPELPEAPSVVEGGLILGSKVDEENKQIYLDVAVAGLTVEQFKSLIAFSAENADKVEVTLSSTGTANGKTVVVTGTKVTVTATNPATSQKAEKTYTVIIMGDTNKNSQTDVGDAVLMLSYQLGQGTKLDANQLLAADMNSSGNVDVGDAVLVLRKMLDEKAHKPVV